MNKLITYVFCCITFWLLIGHGHEVPWPEDYHDSQHTSRSPYVGPQTPYVKWQFTNPNEYHYNYNIYVDENGYIYWPPFIISREGNFLRSLPFFIDGRRSVSMLLGNMIIHALNGHVSAYSKDTLELLWSYNFDPPPNLDYNIHIVRGKDIIYVPCYYHIPTGIPNTVRLQSKLVALSLGGTVKWEEEFGLDSYVYLSADTDGTLYCLVYGDIRVFDPNGNPKKYIWVDGCPPLVISKTHIYVGYFGFGEKMYAVNKDTGKIEWTITFLSTPNYFYEDMPEIVLGWNDVVYAKRKSTLYAISLDGSIKWTYSLETAGRYGLSKDVVVDANDTVYVCAGDCLYAIDANGELKWKYCFPGETVGGPVIGGPGELYVVSCREGRCNLYAIGEISLHGELEGYVKEKVTGKSIAGAFVNAGGRSTFTNTDGYYTLSLPPGTYTVRVSAQGYSAVEKSGVQVEAGSVTTVDFELIPIVGNAPIAQASDISGQPQVMYPQTEYTVTTKYFDPDGRANLKYCYLRLNHPQKPLTMTWDEDTGQAAPWADEQGANYLSSVSVQASPIRENGIDGYLLRWTFKINEQWPSVLSSIKFCIKAVDEQGQASDWACTDAGVSFAKDRDELLKLLIASLRIPQEDIVVTVDDQQYIIATLQHRIDPNTLQIVPDSSPTKIYIDPQGAPIANGALVQKISVIEEAIFANFNVPERVRALQQIRQKAERILSDAATWGIVGLSVSGSSTTFTFYKKYQLYNFIEFWLYGVNNDIDAILKAAQNTNFPTSLITDLVIKGVKKLFGDPLQITINEFLIPVIDDAIENYQFYLNIDPQYFSLYSKAYRAQHDLLYGLAWEEVAGKLAAKLFGTIANEMLLTISKIKPFIITKVPVLETIKAVTNVIKAFYEYIGAIDWLIDVGFYHALLPYQVSAQLDYGLTLAGEYTLFLANKPEAVSYFRIKKAEELARGYQAAQERVDAIVNILPDPENILRWLKKTFGVKVNSPVEIRVQDSKGRVTGVIQGARVAEIPDSFYIDEDESIIIYNAEDQYTVVAVGTAEGAFRLATVFAEFETQFVALDFPCSLGSTYAFSFDWEALAQGEPGVTIKIDYNGDGITERTIKTGSQATPTDLESPTLFLTGFSNLKNWQATGLWHVTSVGCVSCPNFVGRYAYFGKDETCTYETLDRRGRPTRSQGILTSPVIPVPKNTVLTIQFDYFREVENYKRSTLDRTYVQIRLGRESRGRILWSGWKTIWSRSSKDSSPECDTATYAFPTQNYTNLQIRFVFDSVNAKNNGYRGWAVDNLVVKPASTTAPPRLEVADLGEGWDVPDAAELGELQVVNVPNPIRDVRTTTFTVLGVEAEALRVEVYDLTGRLVWKGETEGNELPWHTEDLTGLPLANGVYLYLAYVKVDGEWIRLGPQKLVILR